ncbi:MAG: purine-binding chemotaxis protein CheW, partial [Deltaproteobacteria bacterium]|nr:purine-binding chemotaxis protein CheW [Deltaproteobacteria bacterium]
MAKTVDAKDTVFQLVAFKVGKEEFSIPITKVQEIIRMPEITKVPRTPDFVEGVINLRGKVIPVVDLRKRFGLDVSEKSSDTRVIVVDSSGKIVGFMVDAVTEVLRLSASTVEPAPSLIGGIDS